MQIVDDKSYGVVPVYQDENGDFLFCLVEHAGEHWAFPKGHAKPGETPEQTARRELTEETGILDIELVPDCLLTEKYTFEKDVAQYNKEVVYFLGITKTKDTYIQSAFVDEISKIIWLPYSGAEKQVTYETTRATLKNAVTQLSKIK